jgi:hypothetical protein
MEDLHAPNCSAGDRSNYRGVEVVVKFDPDDLAERQWLAEERGRLQGSAAVSRSYLTECTL